MDELAPCPFCIGGGSPAIGARYYKGNPVTFAVVCQCCHTQTVGFKTEEAARIFWNSRPGFTYKRDNLLDVLNTKRQIKEALEAYLSYLVSGEMVADLNFISNLKPEYVYEVAEELGLNCRPNTGFWFIKKKEGGLNGRRNVQNRQMQVLRQIRILRSDDLAFG